MCMHGATLPSRGWPSVAAADGWRRCRWDPPPPPIAWRSSRRHAATQTGSCVRGLSGLARFISTRAPNYIMPSEPHEHAWSEPPIACSAFRRGCRCLAPLPMVPTASSMRVAAQPTACGHSTPLRVRPFAGLRGASRAGDRAPLACTQRAVRRALKLPLLPQMAGAAADGTHRHLPSRGGPADGVLQLKLARACVV